MVVVLVLAVGGVALHCVWLETLHIVGRKAHIWEVGVEAAVDAAMDCPRACTGTNLVGYRIVDSSKAAVGCDVAEGT